MKLKKLFNKSFLSVTATAAALTLFTTGCPEKMILGEKKSGEVTPPHLQEKVKTAGFDVNGKPIELAIDGKNITGIKPIKESVTVQSDRDSLIKIVIPDGVEKIEDNKFYLYGEVGAFGGCHNLQSVTLPESLTVIGEGSFNHCERLTAINIPKSVIIIGKRAFIGCTALELNVPANVTVVGKGAFVAVKKLQIAKDNPVLKQFEDGSVVDASRNALVYVKPGLDEYHVKGVSRIDAYTFEKSGLKKVVLDNNIKEIGYKAFYGSNVSTVVLSNSLITISASAFEECKNLTKIEIPASVQIIGNNAFYYCSNLREVKLSEGLITIKNKAFRSPHLVLDIPASVTDFDPASQEVKAIRINPANKTYRMGKSGEIIHIATSTLVYVPKSLTGKYVVPSDVKVIAKNALNYCDNITEIYVHDNVTDVHEQAFSGGKRTRIVSVGPKTNVPKYNSSFLGENDKFLVRRPAK